MPLILLIALLAALFFFVFVPRMNELFLISVRDGQLLVVRGRVSARMKQDLMDIVKRARVRRATIRAVRASGHARLMVSGVDEGVAQRMRNAFGTHREQKLSATRTPGPRNLGQWLGIAWLAWLFLPRD